MDSMGEDEKVLSYADVVLRRSDLKILQGHYYLNDRIMEFYFCYLSSFSSPKILLVAPSVSFWILNAPDVRSLQLFVDPLNLPDKELVIFPVNDNIDVNMAGGGSHWSLLVYHRARNIFEHYDSHLQCNSLYAGKLFENIKSFMGPPASSSTLTLHFTPQQRNGYDCGVFVLAIVKELCACEGNISGDDWEAVLKSRVTTSAVGEMRSQILKIIDELSS
jgi:sentrin-specific protease 8